MCTEFPHQSPKKEVPLFYKQGHRGLDRGTDLSKVTRHLSQDLKLDPSHLQVTQSRAQPGFSLHTMPCTGPSPDPRVLVLLMG